METSTVERIVQVGTVSAVEGTNARVTFQDTGITSDWLPVLQRRDEIVEVIVQNSTAHTHSASASVSCDGEGSPSASVTIGEGGVHTHVATAKVVSWVPKVGDVVVVLFLPVFNSDGFILGGV